MTGTPCTHKEQLDLLVGLRLRSGGRTSTAGAWNVARDLQVACREECGERSPFRDTELLPAIRPEDIYVRSGPELFIQAVEGAFRQLWRRLRGIGRGRDEGQA